MYSMVKTRSGKTTHPVYRKRQTNKQSNFLTRSESELSSVAKRSNSDLKRGLGSVTGEVGSVARSAERGLEYGVKGVGSAIGEVGSIAKGAEHEIENLTSMFSKHNIKGGRRTRSKRRRNKKRARSTKKR